MAVQVNSSVFNENGDRQVGGFCPNIFFSGFDTKFICKHCHCILRDPVQSQCGHRFCYSCRDELLVNNRQVNCPACLEEQVDIQEVGQLSMNLMFPDNAVKREMSVMATSCVFPGCSWRGRFKEYEAHERSCEFRQIACGLCAQPVSNGHIDEHKQTDCPQRHVVCDFCQTETVFARLQSHHDICEKFPVTCDLCNLPNIAREGMKVHMEQQCSKRRIKCPMGCAEQFQHDKFPEHLHMCVESHLAWTVERLMILEHKIEDTIGSVEMTPANFSQVVGDVKSIEKKIQNFERHVQKCMQDKPSTHMDISGSETQRSDGPISAEVAAKASLKLVEPILGVIHHELDRALHSLQVLEGHYRQQQAQLDEIENQFRLQQQQLQLKDAALADVEMRLAAQELARYDGTILWKVSGFEGKKREAISGQTTSLYSPAFYSGPCGYKMCARIYPNGDGIGKGSHISLFFVIMRGHYDALLPWPFSQKVTLMMIDQNHKEHIVDAFKPDPTSSSFKRPTTEMNIASGCPLFLPLDKLHSRQYGYLRDDTIFVKIIVDTEGLDRYTEMNPGRFSTGYP
ncbi:unnamed protein product [Candidula unifasciata]|uniref:TNF receptor-associated factor n=1 Tax=Candidula unifasciata TaxID=100452 RepID=A0A8S3ZZH9_9EUPU|nr:unnamed protein product [Candidula unifasciata]